MMEEKMRLIKCGKLFDGVKEELQKGMEISIEGNRIKEVGRNLPHGNADVIDLSALTVTPGLIDAHVHVDIMDWRLEGLKGAYSDGWAAMASARCVEKTLRRGFTTVRNAGAFGCLGYVLQDVRRAIDLGYLKGSRLVIAQGNGGTGSHGDFSQSMDSAILSHCAQHMHAGLGDGPDFFRRSIREQKKYGYDFIKLMATGGFASDKDKPTERQLCDDEIKMIMETAHSLGMTVTAHAYFSDLITKLVDFGIDGIEHAALIDAQTARFMEEKKVYVVPTFAAYEPVVHWNEEEMRKKPAAAYKKYSYYQEHFREGRKVLMDSNLCFGYGSDLCSIHCNYESGYEYVAWLKSDIDPYRALKAATSANADILRRPEIGVVAPGMLADISAWSRDLLADPYALLECSFVMKDGVVYETETGE